MQGGAGGPGCLGGPGGWRKTAKNTKKPEKRSGKQHPGFCAGGVSVPAYGWLSKLWSFVGKHPFRSFQKSGALYSTPQDGRTPIRTPTRRTPHPYKEPYDASAVETSAPKALLRKAEGFSRAVLSSQELGTILEAFRDNFRTILGPFWDHFGELMVSRVHGLSASSQNSGSYLQGLQPCEVRGLRKGLWGAVETRFVSYASKIPSSIPPQSQSKAQIRLN